ncbi:MAG: molybdopterin-dependent oxidoreductase, partial [Pseudomonadales bacterium]|nr:molybdopterin-dependent oxidoreductase [Pseudomonadales bacterium]
MNFGLISEPITEKVRNRTFQDIHTTCPYCGVGCGINASLEQMAASPEPRLKTVSGLAGHPANHGRLCGKGAALHETLGHQGRLLHPKIKGCRSDWNTALDVVAAGFRDVIRRHGPDAVAFYLSGQLLTEDYYVANKLMKGFIGSGNVDTNSRLCMASAVSSYKRAFGADAVPCCYEDLECCDLLVLVGSNAAWT